MELHNWSDIRDKLRGSILLGNGASIAIDERLSYRSLYEQVCESGRLNHEIIDMFDHFETKNFEFIMKLLLEASRVNEVLHIQDNKTRDYYHEIRDSLIDTIRDIHPTHESVQHLLPKVACFLMGFTDVLSLNYDLLVYWSMMQGNERLGCTWFKDGFVGGAFDDDFSEYMYRPQPPAVGATIVSYPHGSLFLVTDIDGYEEKLSRSKDGILLDTILNKWKEKDYIPLFVSEGDTTAKSKAIGRSNYLRAAYDTLKKITGSLVIYGWSAGEQDEHILAAIDHKGISEIAVSVHTDSPHWESYCERMTDLIGSTHNLRGANLYFFDSKCKGCWVF